MKRWRHYAMGVALFVFLLATTSGNTWAQASSTVKYDLEEGLGGGTSISLSATLYRPSIASPAAAVIVLHGCPGPIGPIFDWAKRIAAWGYVAIVPDSFGSRSKTNVCNEPMVMAPGSRVLDVLATVEYLATLPFVKHDRIALVGFSHGAGTVIDALQGSLSSVGIRGGVAYYPVCIPEQHHNVSVPLLVLIGDKDDWAPAAHCRALQQRFRHPSLTEIIVYSGAYHAFDINAPPQSISGADFSRQDGSVGAAVQHHIEYDAIAARDAEARTRSFLEKQLKSAPK